MRVLVMRTSAMGDVALLTPVIKAMREQFPDVEITLLTRRAFVPFFEGDTSIEIFTPDFKSRHKGIAGLFRLFSDINRKGTYDHVIDLHEVIRTSFLQTLFRIKKIPVSVIEKGRRAKNDLINGKNRDKLPHTVERYFAAFRKAGFDLKNVPGPYIIPDPELIIKAEGVLGNSDSLNIGVAPYAKHLLKLWPEEYMVQLLSLISEKYKSRFWFFGGNDEKTQLDTLVKKIPGAINLCHRFSLKEELAIMSRLDLMIAMDSSNMHMAALVGIPVISIWGGTDPVTGFGAWMQPESYSIAISHNELECRPCTVYGKGTCRRGDHACMNWLTPQIVFSRIEETGLLNGKSITASA